MNEDILEKLSELEHKQWCEWSQAISFEISLLINILDKFEDDLSDDDLRTIFRIKDKLVHWRSLRVPYSDLSEDEKDKDRVYAKKALTIFNEKY